MSVNVPLRDRRVYWPTAGGMALHGVVSALVGWHAMFGPPIIYGQAEPLNIVFLVTLNVCIVGCAFGLSMAINIKLQRETEALAAHMHELYGIGATPEAVYSAKCEKCSLMDSCVPKAPGGKGAVERYLARAIEEAGE